MHERFLQNIPSMSPLQGNSEGSPEQEVVPLDFNTAMIEDGKLVIKAKPIQYSPDEEEKQ